MNTDIHRYSYWKKFIPFTFPRGIKFYSLRWIKLTQLSSMLRPCVLLQNFYWSCAQCDTLWVRISVNWRVSSTTDLENHEVSPSTVIELLGYSHALLNYGEEREHTDRCTSKRKLLATFWTPTFYFLSTLSDIKI